MTRPMKLSSQRVDEGAAAVEYGLLVAAIAAVVLAVTFVIGTWAKGTYQDACDQIDQTGTGVVADGSC
jgi:pilus assembly protein Flp/PilA